MRSSAKLGLIAVANPPNEFYKDEGGKSNRMSFHVALYEVDSNPPCAHRLRAGEALVLKASLYFESEQPVRDDPSILNVIGGDETPPMIDSGNNVAVVHFRLEKVSRRKDGQRFKVLLEPDLVRSTFPRAKELQGVFSTAVCVLSKRKAPSAAPAPPPVAPANRVAAVAAAAAVVAAATGVSTGSGGGGGGGRAAGSADGASAGGASAGGSGGRAAQAPDPPLDGPGLLKRLDGIEQVLLKVDSYQRGQSERLAALEQAVCLVVLGHNFKESERKAAAATSQGGESEGMKGWQGHAVSVAVDNATSQLIAHSKVPGALSNTLSIMAQRAGIPQPDNAGKGGTTGMTHVSTSTLNRLIQSADAQQRAQNMARDAARQPGGVTASGGAGFPGGMVAMAQYPGAMPGVLGATGYFDAQATGDGGGAGQDNGMAAGGNGTAKHLTSSIHF